jgi:hypothetical protein
VDAGGTDAGGAAALPQRGRHSPSGVLLFLPHHRQQAWRHPLGACAPTRSTSRI